MNSTRSIVYVTTVRGACARLSTSSLKQLGCTVRVNPTYTNQSVFSNNGLNQIVIFHASVNPAGSFHVKSSGDFHGPPPILLKFGTLVGIV